MDTVELDLVDLLYFNEFILFLFQYLYFDLLSSIYMVCYENIPCTDCGVRVN